MQLDPTVVQAFSTQVGEASSTISNTHLGGQVVASSDGVAGSSSQYAARLAGQFMTNLVADYSANVARMGTSVRAASATIVAQDDAVKADLDGAWAQN